MIFESGDTVTVTCYGEHCQGVSIPVILGEKAKIMPGTIFKRAGRFSWSSDEKHQSFNLTTRCNCPNCGTAFGGVVVVAQGRFVFGYDPEPA